MRNFETNKERGIALLMAVFTIALASIIVLEVGYRSRYDQKASRVFAESVQADFILKSSLNFARVLIELPKQIGEDNVAIKEDWLGDPWALIAAAPSLPVSGFGGEVRMLIVDNDGRIDFNSTSSSVSSANPFTDLYSNAAARSASDTPTIDPAGFWKDSLSSLFFRNGFEREKHEADSYRTPGDISYAAEQQVAVLQDWIDSDRRSYSSAQFGANGIESTADKTLFFNRPLASVSEVLLVPGFTLSRLSDIASFVTVGDANSSRGRRININTAPLQVLMAIGFSDREALEIVEQRANLPYSQEMLDVLVSENLQLKRHTKVTSNEFGVYIRVETANAVRWLRGRIKAYGSSPRRRTDVAGVEFY